MIWNHRNVFKRGIVCGLILLLCSSICCQTNKKIGYANMQAVRYSLPQYDSLLIEYDNYSSSFEKELSSLTQLMNSKSEQIDTASESDKKRQLQSEHQELTALLADYNIAVKREIALKKEMLFAEIELSIEEATEVIKLRHAYDLIYDSSITKIPPILDATDITDQLKKELGL
jgi:Skp family chaperone for outer membrane proteins